MVGSLVGERRALSLLVLGFYTSLFLLVALAVGDAWGRCFFALAATYGLAFFALAAEWFWARWFALGLAGSGVTLSIFGLVTGGWNPGLALWGGMHLVIYFPLLGQKMAERYDYQEAWRQRYRLDENGVERIRRTVKSTAAALPTLIFYTLAPREESQWTMVALLGLVLLGAVGLLRMRVWGLALLAAGAVGAWATAFSDPSMATLAGGWGAIWLPGAGVLTALFLSLAVAPYVVPAYRFVRRED